MAPVVAPAKFPEPDDVVSTIEELVRLDAEYDTWSGREVELHAKLQEEISQLHRALHGSNTLQDCTRDLMDRIDAYRENLGGLGLLSARTEFVNKEMIKSRREKEEQKREKVRQESLIKLKRCRNELKDVGIDLVQATRQCLQELATVQSQKLLSTIHSENSLREVIDQTKLQKVCTDDGFGATARPKKTMTLVSQAAKTHPVAEKSLTEQCGEVLALVVIFRQLMSQILQAKADCSVEANAPSNIASASALRVAQNWAEELELLEDIAEDAEAIIQESFIICKILLVRRLEIISSDGCQRIPQNLIQLFSQTQNFKTLVKLITEAIPEPSKTPIVSIMGGQINYYYNQMSEVTSLFKRDIDRYYYVIYGSEEGLCHSSESWAVFESLLNAQRAHAADVYDEFHQEVAKHAANVEHQNVKDLHPLLHEALLICANVISVQKSIRKITSKIDKARESLQWLDTHGIRNDLIKLVSLYLQKAWESAKLMDDCGIIADQPDALLAAPDNGSTMVDDIFFVIKEVTQQMVNLKDADIMKTYTALVENLLCEIPSTLRENAMKAMELFNAVLLRPSNARGLPFTMVYIRDLPKPSPQSGTTGSPKKNMADTASSAVSFPHALTSLKSIQVYAGQVQDQLRSPPTTPKNGESPHAVDRELMAGDGVVGPIITMSVFYQQAFDEVKSIFASKIYDHVFAKQFFVPPTGHLDEEQILERLNSMCAYFDQVWAPSVASELSLELLKMILQGLEQSIKYRVDPSAIASNKESVPSSLSVLNVFSTAAKSADNGIVTDPKADGPVPAMVGTITFDEALIFDALVRHLLEWADEKLEGMDIREHFLHLLEICDLITVDTVADILDISASTQWHLDECVAVKLLRARTDMQRYAQLDHVINLLVSSGVFRKASPAPS